ncbi:MAG: histidine kinase [Salegentibacter sp.]
MPRKKYSFYFLFLLEKKLRIIKTQTTIEQKSAERIKKRSKLSVVLEKIKIAALTSIFLYITFAYLHLGFQFFTKEGLATLSFFNLLELIFAFIFLLAIFWSHTQISRFVHSPAFTRAFKGLNPIWKPVAEALLVLISSFIALTLANFLPLYLLLYPEVQPKPESLRVGYVLSGVLSLFFYFYVEKNRNQQQLQAEMLRSAHLQKENFEAQLQNLKDQVNPHFLFNSLNVLGSLIYKNQEQAVEFTRKLSDMYRSYLDNSNDPLIPLRKDLEVTKAYIYLLETRFGKAVEFRLNIATDMQELFLPPGAVQMLIENAIKHNGSTRKNPLVIHIYTEDDRLIVKNRLQARRNKIVSTKTGLKNIRSRYQFLTNQEVIITKSEEEFIVKLPLLKVEANENSNS